jgi:anti-anti-sigma factor
MEIALDRRDNIPTISLTGRLDAFGASQLDAALEDFIRDDDPAIVIDMGNVSYLSSAGIRTLIAAERTFKRRNGRIHLCNVNAYPLKVLQMSGFDQLFFICSTKQDAITSWIAVEAMRQAERDWHRLPAYRRRGAQFTIFEASGKEAVLNVVGDISKVLYAQLEEKDIFSRRFSETEYSIGLGALGESVEDCIHILGEMITIGGTMVWLPTDGNDTPDFLIPKRDTGEVTIRTGFNVALDGVFNDVVAVECEGDTELTMGHLYAAIFELARERRAGYRGLLSLAMRAEVGEVYSSGVKISPVNDFRPENHEMIMHEDNISTWLDINAIPKYRGETMVSFGMGIDLTSDLSYLDEGAMNALFYLHPANVGNRKMLLHNHGVVFKHVPWHRNLNLDDEIRKIATEGEFVDMRHLLDNTRITRAVVGVSYISAIVFERG